MAQSYFVWNGTDCRTMGVSMRGPAPIIRGEERAQHVTIPGVAGDLTETEGSHIYNSYIQTVSISVRGAGNVRNILKWLSGSGYVTFSGEPDRKQKARVIGAVTLNRISRNIDRWAGEVQFYCQPLKEALREESVTITSSGSTVRNYGDVTCYPKISAVANATSMTITVGGKTLTLTGLTSGNTYRIYCDIMEVTNSSGSASLTKNSSGTFPSLAPGNNTITGSGWSSLVIERRERYL